MGVQHRLGGYPDPSRVRFSGLHGLDGVILCLKLRSGRTELSLPGTQGYPLQQAERIQIRDLGVPQHKDLLGRGIKMEFLPTADDIQRVAALR